MLSGCNSVPVLIQSPVAPPVQYMQECPEPTAAKPLTNAGLAQYALDARDVIRGCNLDKAALREWAKGLEK